MKKLSFILFCILTLNSFAASKHLINPKDTAAQAYSFGVRIVGNGKPMILIPGLKGSPDTYNEIAAHYKDHYKCYIITLAGFAGQPASGEQEHPLQKQRDDIIRFIMDKHLRKPVLVGFSFGGSLALWITTTRPDLVGPLIELDAVPFDAAIDNELVNIDTVRKKAKIKHESILKKTPAFWKHIDSLRQTAAFRKEGFIYLEKLVTDTARINQILDWDDASDYKASALMENEMDVLDLRESVKKIRSPVLVLGSWQGWDGIKTKTEVEKRYADQYAPVKNVTIAFSEKGKHFLMYEDFDWMIRNMDDFLAKGK